MNFDVRKLKERTTPAGTNSEVRRTAAVHSLHLVYGMTVQGYFEYAMTIDRETLLIVQFLRLVDRDGICQSQLACTMNLLFFPHHGQGLEHSTTWLPAWTPQGLIRPSDMEKLGQSVIDIVLYQEPMDTFLDPTNSVYPHDRTIIYSIDYNQFNEMPSCGLYFYN